VQKKDIEQNAYLREEEKVELCMQRQRRRSESSRRCENEDTDAGRAEQCSRTVMRLVSH
jgi:hypothetical protein